MSEPLPRATQADLRAWGPCWPRGRLDAYLAGLPGEPFAAEDVLTRERDAGRRPDPRSVSAICVMRDYALGTATIGDLRAAAYAAAPAYAAAAEWDTQVDRLRGLLAWGRATGRIGPEEAS